MAISPRQVVSDDNSGGAASVATGAATVGTDLLVAVGYSNYYDVASGFGPPTGGSWTEQVTADRGEFDAHVRVWTRTATGGAQTVELSPISDEEVGLVVLVLEGADLDTPTDGAAAGTSAASTPSVHVAPSVSPATEDAYLISAAAVETFGGGTTYTQPSGMTEQVEIDLLGASGHLGVATEQLSASGPTGSRDWTYAQDNMPGCALNIAIRAAGGAAAQDVTPAAVTVTAAAGSLAIGAAVTPAGAAVTAGPGSLAMGVGITPSGILVTAGTGTMSVAPGTVAVTPDPVSIATAPGTLAVAVVLSPGPATVTATPGTAALTVDVPVAGPAVTATPGTATVVQGLAVVPGPVTVTASAGSVTVSTGTTEVTPAAVSVAAGPGALTLQMAVGPAGATVSTTVGALTVTIGAAVVSPGVATVSVTAGQVEVWAPPLYSILGGAAYGTAAPRISTDTARVHTSE